MRKLIALVVGCFVLAGLAEAQSKRAMDLIKKLSDKEAKVRKEAAEGLAELADIKITDARAGLPALVQAMKDADPGVRRAAIEALGKIEPEKFPALLGETLKKEKDGVVLIGAVNAAGQLVPPPKELLPVLQETYKASPQAAPKVTGKTITPQPGDSDPPAVRRAILAAIARIQPDAKERLPFLVESLKVEKDLSVQVVLINGLGQIGPPAKGALPMLTAVQKASLAEAAKIGPKDMRELDPQGLRRTILAALVRIETDPKERLAELVNALKFDKDGQVRQIAVTNLGQLGPAAKPAVEPLLEVHKSLAATGDPQGLRRSIVAAIRQIETDPKESVPLLVDVLRREKDAGARQSLVIALGDIGPAAKPAVPALLEVFKGSPAQPKGPTDPQGVRRAVVDTLSKVDAEAKDIVPMLITTVRQDRDPAVRTAAVSLLGKLGPEAKAAIPALETLAKSKLAADKALAQEAQSALAKIQKQ